MRSKRVLFCVVAAGLAGCSNGNDTSPNLHGSLPSFPPYATSTAPSSTATFTVTTPAPTASPTASSTAAAGPTATPVAAPTATASGGGTAAPVSGTIVSSSNPLIFPMNPAAGCGDSLGFSVTETGYSGAFTATSSNAAFVTLTQQDGHDFTATEPTTAVPTATTNVTVTVSDSLGHTLVIPARFNEICLP